MDCSYAAVQPVAASLWTHGFEPHTVNQAAMHLDADDPSQGAADLARRTAIAERAFRFDTQLRNWRSRRCRRYRQRQLRTHRHRTLVWLIATVPPKTHPEVLIQHPNCRCPLRRSGGFNGTGSAGVSYTLRRRSPATEQGRAAIEDRGVRLARQHRALPRGLVRMPLPQRSQHCVQALRGFAPNEEAAPRKAELVGKVVLSTESDLLKRQLASR